MKSVESILKKRIIIMTVLSFILLVLMVFPWFDTAKAYTGELGKTVNGFSVWNYFGLGEAVSARTDTSADGIFNAMNFLFTVDILVVIAGLVFSGIAIVYQFIKKKDSFYVIEKFRVAFHLQAYGMGIYLVLTYLEASLVSCMLKGVESRIFGFNVVSPWCYLAFIAPFIGMILANGSELQMVFGDDPNINHAALLFGKVKYKPLDQQKQQ